MSAFGGSIRFIRVFSSMYCSSCDCLISLLSFFKGYGGSFSFPSFFNVVIVRIMKVTLEKCVSLSRYSGYIQIEMMKKFTFTVIDIS